MKILFFIESLRAGGKERRILELLKGLKRYPDIELELVITRKDIHYQEFYTLEIPLHVIERKFLKKDPLVFFKFYRLVKKLRPDIIHAWGNMVAVYSVPAVKRLGIPLLNNQITDATPNQKPLGKNWAFRASSRIIANTRAGLHAYHAPMEKSGVIYNGFNFSRLENLRPSEEVKEELKIKTRFTVAMVATISPYKDYATFIKAAQSILGKRRDVTFLCVGEGDSTALGSLISAENKPHIIFTGKRNHVESIMNVCDAGVLVTDVRNHAEGISNALLEFMALGKPVIATNAGGSVELIEEGKTGYLIDAFSDAQLRDRLLNLLGDDGLRAQLGQAARTRVEQHFSIDSMVSSFYNEYRALFTIKNETKQYHT
jgi:glycosyltransferase involved in cell wall biosynthesis